MRATGAQPHSSTTLETGARGASRKQGVLIASPEQAPLQLAAGPPMNEAGGPMIAESLTEAAQGRKKV